MSYAVGVTEYSIGDNIFEARFVRQMVVSFFKDWPIKSSLSVVVQSVKRQSEFQMLFLMLNIAAYKLAKRDRQPYMS